jgi:hypothetical protein
MNRIEPTPHPLNRDFEWVPLRPRFATLTFEQATNYDENGFFVIEDALDADTVAGLLAEIDPFERELEGQLRLLQRGKASSGTGNGSPDR